MITKAKNKDFQKRVKSILEANGYNHVKGYTEFIYEKKTSVGTLKITLHDESIMYGVYMKFDRDLNKGLFEKIRPNENYNKFSYKWNILTGDVEYAVNELESRVLSLK